MKEYGSCDLRNIAILAHGKAGKTSLTEALAYNAGHTNRLGKVDDGTTVADFEPEEIKRKLTISNALVSCEWEDTKLNFIDTPGYPDFFGEVKGALSATDSALIVVCAPAGIEVETEKVWNYCKELNKPTAFFVNKMDREHADFNNVVEQLQIKFGAGIVPIQIPIGAEEAFHGVVDLLEMSTSIKTSQKQIIEGEIPEFLKKEVAKAKERLVETIVETNPELLDRYLAGEEISDNELITTLKLGIKNAKLFPVLCGSALKNIGVNKLLYDIIEYLPEPSLDNLATNNLTEELVEINENSPFSGLVFKTTADPFVGRLSYIRIFSGSLTADSTVYNPLKDKVEKIGNIFSLRGKQQINLKKGLAGDIVVVAKLQDTVTGDSLTDKSFPVVFDEIIYPKPMFTMAVETKNKGDEDKLSNALVRILDEDPTVRYVKSAETAEFLLSGIGEMHTEIIADKIKRKFGVELLLKNPKIPYRETIRMKEKVEAKHKKQSGGHGQYGHVWLQIEPLPPGTGIEFTDSIFGGAVPRQYIPAVEKGVKEALQAGILAGYPVVDVKVDLCDGSYHNVDSSEMAFKIASAAAVKKAVMQAKPVLLEPIYDLEITIPEYYMGDVIADLNTKRGRINGMDSGLTGIGVVKAQAPVAELFRFAIDLRSITQGRGFFDMKFSHYEEVPQKIAQEIIDNAKDKTID